MDEANGTPLGSLAAAIAREIPDAQLSVDAPQNPDGLWFLDIEHAGRHAIVQWQEYRGFGLCYGPGEFYGEGPDEHCKKQADAAGQLLDYLRSKLH